MQTTDNDVSTGLRRVVSRLLLAALSLLGVAALTACGGPGPDLASLRNDPMAKYVPPGTKLVSASDDKRTLNSSTNKSHPADLFRTYSIPASADESKLLDLASDAARKAGWTVERGKQHEIVGARYANGLEGSQTASLGVYIGDKSGGAGRELHVIMTNPDGTTINLPPK